MSSLWKRASAPQRRMLRIVAGAVANAADAHPGASIDKKFARSVAKRAVGTISSQWTELLAAKDLSVSSSNSGAVPGTSRVRRRRAELAKPRERGRSLPAGRPSPFEALLVRMAKLVKPARMSGQDERADALIAALQAIGRVVKDEKRKAKAEESARIVAKVEI